MKCDYEYHPLVSNIQLDPHMDFMPPNIEHPSRLKPDQLSLFINIGESKAVVSGIIVKIFLDLKDNYFGSYDQVLQFFAKL